MVGRERGNGEQTENKESPATQGGTLVKRPVVVQWFERGRHLQRQPALNLRASTLMVI
jgi:hypothetical protein